MSAKVSASAGSGTSARVIVASVLYLIMSVIGTIVAVVQERPAEFLGTSTGLPALQDWLYGMGTAFSPPFYWMAVQVVFMVLAPKSGKAGTVGLLGLAIIGGTNTFGALAEPITYTVFNPATFDPLGAAIQVGMVILPFAMMIVAVQEWSRRRR